MGNASLLAIFTISLGIVWVSILCIYRLYFHPFAKYPGPFYAKISNAYSAYQAYKQNTHVVILELHRKYGSVIRYGPNRLLFDSAQSLEDIYGPHRNFYKGAAYDAMRVQPCPSVFNVRSDEVHARRRKIVSQGFSETVMRTSQPTILKHITRYCNTLFEDQLLEGSSWTKAKDLTVWSAYLSVDLIADLILGVSTDMIVRPDNRIYNAARKANFKRMGLAIQWPAVFMSLNRAIRSLNVGDMVFSTTGKLQREWHALLGSWVDARVREMRSAKPEMDQPDMISAIVRSLDDESGRGLSDGELVAELTTLLIAGSGTITTGMTSTLFYLAHNQEAYAAVVQEVRKTFGSLDDIQVGLQLKSCKALQAVFQEAMRMSPPPTTPLYREAGQGGATVCGRRIPAGCEVATTIYALHHNEAHFPESFTFAYKRWLPSGNDNSNNLAKSRAAWAPFSYGPRNCVGMALATNEVLIAVARLLWQGDFQLAEDPDIAAIGNGSPELGAGRHRPNEFQMYDTFGASTEGPYLQFRRRKMP